MPGCLFQLFDEVLSLRHVKLSKSEILSCNCIALGPSGELSRNLRYSLMFPHALASNMTLLGAGFPT